MSKAVTPPKFIHEGADICLMVLLFTQRKRQRMIQISVCTRDTKHVSSSKDTSRSSILWSASMAGHRYQRWSYVSLSSLQIRHAASSDMMLFASDKVHDDVRYKSTSDMSYWTAECPFAGFFVGLYIASEASMVLRFGNMWLLSSSSSSP